MTLNGSRLSCAAEDELLGIFEDSAIRFKRDASISTRTSSAKRSSIWLKTRPYSRLGAQKVGARKHYHLRHSRNRVAGVRVRDPRHYLVVQIEGDRLAVLAVVHDAMVEGATRRIEEGEAG